MEHFRFQKLSSDQKKLYSHNVLPGLFEVEPINHPQVYPELSECIHFMDCVELLKHKGCFYMIIPYQGYDLSLIREENEHIEETYISLIIRTIVDALAYLHARKFFKLDLRLENWRVLPCGTLKAKDRFSLTRLISDIDKDIEGLRSFTSKLSKIKNLNDPEVCVSLLFKQFLNCISNLDVDRFKGLRGNKFIKKCNSSNILTDLIESYVSLSELSRPTSQSKAAKFIENSFSSQGQLDIGEDEFSLIVTNVFQKSILNERANNREKVCAILENIKRSVIILYKSDPEKAFKIIKFHSK